MDKIIELAKMIDHSILHPTMTDDVLKRECEKAIRYNTASVCVKPFHVKVAKEYVNGTDVLICAVIGFPHGNSKIETKIFETSEAIRDGATEIDMVVNIGKVLGEDWDYIESEIEQINDECVKNKAILKVIFETDFLKDNKYKVKLCEICNKYKVAYAKTSTGYGFVKGKDGRYSYQGATIEDIKLMKEHLSPEVQMKASGGVRTLDDMLKFKELGVTRFGATATAEILEEAKRRFNK